MPVRGSNACVGESCHLVRGELSDSDEALDAAIAARADEADSRGTKVLTTKPFKNLDEDELNGQAVIEPENDFLVFGKISERLIKRFEAFASAFEAVTAGF